MRHKDLCIIENGVVATDAINKNGYSTVDIVNNALERWYEISDNKSELVIEGFPMKRERQDVYCMRSIYDFDSISCEKMLQSSFETTNEEVLKARIGMNFGDSVECRKLILN